MVTPFAAFYNGRCCCVRKLMWFTIGFATACGVSALVWEIPGLFAIVAIVGCLSMAGMLIGNHASWWKRAAIVLFGMAVGLLWFDIYCSLYLDDAVSLDGETVTVTAQCTDYGYETDYGTAVDATVYLDGKWYRAKLYLNGNADLAPGDHLRGDFCMRVTTPGGVEDATYHQGKGIFLLGYQRSDVQQVSATKSPWYLYPARLRRQISGMLEQFLPADTAGFAKALLLGDRTDIDYETNTAFKISGISHIIAVSGLHVSIVFAMIHALCLKRRLPTVIFGSTLTLLFAAVAGFSPSVTRAALMQVLMLAAMLFDKEYDGPTELAFSALVMLVANPLVITSVSFQLSVGCIVGIFLFRESIARWILEKLERGKKNRFTRVKHWFSDSVSVTLSATLVTTPLVAYYFGAVSLVGIVTNLLVLWAVTFIFYGLILTCALGALTPAAGGFLAGLVSALISYVLTVAKVLAKIPLAAVYTRSLYMVLWLMFVYVLLAAFLLSKKRRPGLLAGCAAVGFCLALAASWAEPMTDECRMTVLDVGQGQSIILQSEGKSYLVDCGGSYDTDAADLAAETLMSQGIFRLDGIILTHFDRDHSGGLAYLLTRMPTDALFLPDAQDPNEVGKDLETLTDGTVVRVCEDLILEYGDTDLTIFAPALTNSGNESSLAVLFQAGNCDILITGDRSGFGERMLLRQTELPELEILVAGHHGSKNSTCDELLSATRPAIVAISVGDNSYGHPSDEVLARLNKYGCLVYRTDRDGNLIFRR